MVPSDRAESVSEVQRLIEGTGECAFCGEEALDSVFLYSLEDYANTNLGEQPPVRHIRMCAHHYDQMLPETTIVDQQEVPGLAE